MKRLFELARRNGVELHIKYSEHSDTFTVTVVKDFLKKDVTFSTTMYEAAISGPSDFISIMIVDAICDLDRVMAANSLEKEKENENRNY